jgi:hypothetical protein
VNAKVKLIDNGCADLSVLALAEISRFEWEVFRRIEVENVRDAESFVFRDVRSGEVGERSVEMSHA